MGSSSGRICAILLNWNGHKDTIECLNSLRRCTYHKFTAIVVDNGSTDGSIAAIRAAHPSVPIFETQKNLGFAGGNNIGIEWALRKPFEWIFLLNNDTIADPHLFEALLEEAKKHPEAKIFGAKNLNYHARDRIDHLGGMWDETICEFRSLHANEPDSDAIESREVDYVCGAALFMHKTVPQTIGLLEPKFFLFWEETDFCFRARRLGFAVRTAPQAKIWHKGGASFSGGKPHSHYFWWRSRLLWLERNIPYQKRRELLQNIIYPELRKTLRHFLIKSMQRLVRPNNPHLKKKIRRLKAGLFGALHYAQGRYGNCPNSFINK